MHTEHRNAHQFSISTLGRTVQHSKRFMQSASSPISHLVVVACWCPLAIPVPDLCLARCRFNEEIAEAAPQAEPIHTEEIAQIARASAMQRNKSPISP